MKYLTFILFFTTLCCINTLQELQAQSNTPKYSNEFLAIGVGARGLAMAGTSVSFTDDVTSAYWNPAGLLRTREQYELSLMHVSYFGGIANYDYGGFTAALDSNNRIAISVIRFGIDDIPDTRFLIDENGNVDYNNVGSFAEASYAFLFSYARGINLNIKEREATEENTYRPAQTIPIRLGANAKVIHRRAGIFATAWGFGIDVGAQVEYKGFQFGLMGRDITGTYNAYSFNTDAVREVFTQTGNEIPVNSTEITLPRLMLGLARRFETKNQQFGVLTSLGLETTFDGKRNTLIKSDFASVSPALGVELDYKKLIFLRGGIGNFQQITEIDRSQSWTYQPNFGIGLQLKQVVIDYAITNAVDQSVVPYSHVFSVRFLFNQQQLNSLKKQK